MSRTRRFRRLNAVAGSRRRPRALADAMMDRYVDWREACYAVEMYYKRWKDAAASDSSLAYASYLAALEHEELTAAAYAELVNRVGGRKLAEAPA